MSTVKYEYDMQKVICGLEFFIFFWKAGEVSEGKKLI